jgi:hypothetical protein
MHQTSGKIAEPPERENRGTTEDTEKDTEKVKGRLPLALV